MDLKFFTFIRLKIDFQLNRVTFSVIYFLEVNITKIARILILRMTVPLPTKHEKQRPKYWHNRLRHRFGRMKHLVWFLQ